MEEYFDSIADKRELAAIQTVMAKLIAQDGILPFPLAKKVRGKLWELRTRLGNRVFYFIQTGNDVVFLDGYTKKRNRIEQHVLQRVENQYREYLSTLHRKPYTP